ncbi:hypothetical protein TruAng_008213 [Truncatella angustata]|nr:hypothetical protein TruAng_008213 [Truncatella angustata]
MRVMVIPETRELGSHHEWLATASHSPSPVSNRDTWHEIRKQKTWLLKSHPEAVLGNSELGELLAVGSSSGQTAQTSSWQLTQFAAGEMTDTSNGQEVIGAPLIAMAAGSAGDVLRIVRPVSNIWQLDNDGKANVHLLEHAQHQETLWTKDIGTIQRIRAIVSTRKFEPVRWLAVQREFGTSVFRPEYQKVPVVSETFSATEPQAPSYIAPNLLFTIPKSQTGCNLHCDVAFNPGARSKPAQLAIIDEGGNWSIWDVTGTRKRTYKQPRAHLTKCGSILDGILARLPRKHTPNPQWHKVLWLGHSSVHDDDFDEESPSGSKPASVFPSLERSSTLLLCNQKMLRLLDVDLEEFLPDLRVITDGSKDLILDVQLDSQDPRYFYVTTTLRVFVAAVFTPDTLSQERTIRRALILESFPHLRNKNDRHLKLTVTAGPTSSADRTSLVVLYSQHSKWHDVFYIGFSRKFPERIPELLPRLPEAGAKKVTEENSQYRSKFCRLSRVELERKRAVRYLSTRFVLADSVAEFRYRGDRAAPTKSATRLQATEVFQRMIAPVMESYRHALTALLAESHGSPIDLGIYGDAPFDPVFIALQEALETKSFPRKLFSEMVQHFRMPEDYRETCREWQAEIDELRHADPALQITGLGHPQRTMRNGLSIEDLLSDLVSLTLGPDDSQLADDRTNDFVFLVLCRIACEIFLSQHGMTYLPTEIIKPTRMPATDTRSSLPPLPEYLLMETQESVRSTIRSSSLAPSSVINSQASSRASTPASTALSTATEIPEHPDFPLLKALTGCEGLPAQEKLPAPWNLDEDSSRTVFNVDNNTEVTEGMRRRAKQEAREIRKRKRAENLFKLQVEHNMLPSTQPALRTSFYAQSTQPINGLFSQPRVQSSAPAIVMSQPVAGAFGGRSDLERPKKKIKRRKGGF